MIKLFFDKYIEILSKLKNVYVIDYVEDMENKINKFIIYFNKCIVNLKFDKLYVEESIIILFKDVNKIHKCYYGDIYNYIDILNRIIGFDIGFDVDFIIPIMIQYISIKQMEIDIKFFKLEKCNTFTEDKYNKKFIIMYEQELFNRLN